MTTAAVRRLPAVLLVALLGSACGGEDGATAPASSASDTPDATVEGGPVAGSGAGVDPEDVRAWCGAVTAEQLGALTGAEVADVYSSGADLQTCVADLPGNELLLGWGAQPTEQSFEEYVARLEDGSGDLDAHPVELGDGRPAVVAWGPGAPSAFAGTVVDGRVVQVSVAGVVDQDADPEALGDMARQVLAVYVA